MHDRPYRPLLVAVVGCLVACLVGCTATVQGPNAAEPAPGPSAPVVAVPVPSVRVLQLNLCNSGIAGCYTGRSAGAAAAVIRAEKPDLVTVNEVCRDDVAALDRVLAEVVPGGGVTSAFQAARNGRNGEPYRCRNGQEYGVGVVSRWPRTGPVDAGIYPVQDRDDPEERAWLCLDVAADPAVTVCTTHLAYTRRDVAVGQCRYLFETVVADARARDGAGDSGDLAACLPPGSARVDDGGEQHVVATPGLVLDDSRLVDLRGTTDHPGLLVTLRPGPAGPS
jgi:hypothetical protein